MERYWFQGACGCEVASRRSPRDLPNHRGRVCARRTWFRDGRCATSSTTVARWLRGLLGHRGRVCARCTWFRGGRWATSSATVVGSVRGVPGFETVAARPPQPPGVASLPKLARFRDGCCATSSTTVARSLRDLLNHRRLRLSAVRRAPSADAPRPGAARSARGRRGRRGTATASRGPTRGAGPRPGARRRRS